MQSCIGDVKAWATANMLRLNDSKTELMLVTSIRTKHLHNLPTFITIGNAQIPFKQSVKNLGFTLDCHLTLKAHVTNNFDHNFVIVHYDDHDIKYDCDDNDYDHHYYNKYANDDNNIMFK